MSIHYFHYWLTYTTQGKSGVQLLMATFSHFAKNKYQMLIMPITIWSGLEQGWFGASFTVVST